MHDTAAPRLTRHPWVSFPGTLEDVIDRARRLGWEAVSMRDGDPPVSELRPVPADRARPNSLSSRTGLGAQPLHTDGAHLERPPDVIALASPGAHPTSTRLLALHQSVSPLEDLRPGVFSVSGGRARFHAMALARRSEEHTAELQSLMR